MAAPDRVYQLVETFEKNRLLLKQSEYGETEARVQFINPLFETLGWDMTNTAGRAPTDMEVIHEDAVKVGQAHKAPDYGFYAGRERKFFVEAKKPAVNLRIDSAPAFQLRRYAWSARLLTSVLTDFEELAIYDGTVQPDKADPASRARHSLLTYDQYVDRWDEIAGLFSREAVYSGAIEERFGREATKRGKATVDRAFLAEIERWRELLARNIALRNPGLSARELNYAVQMTVDRIIFLRMAEDRDIEPYKRLLEISKGAGVYERLQNLYRLADQRYNSGLFHFQKEHDREHPDDLTPALAIDDRVLRDIFRNLYYPESPYEFSVLPVDVLGQVYEQFLGKVISVTPRGRVEIEEKPEVRKAGGVYYTPAYIVDYIVEHTVGKLLEGRTPRSVRTRGLRIVDPACGSGSFLLGAYEYLLSWYRDWYVADGPEKHQNQLYRVALKADGEHVAADWRLTTDERKRILLDHIHGVDIDPQAVEVTKLSLLLKLLEGESQTTLTRQLEFFQERVLPDLEANIKCGNSLIGPDFYANQQMALLPAEDQYRINVFDWPAAFPDVFKGDNPGFDAVIGNPPYGVPFTRYELQYVTDHYPVTSKFPDSYCLFMAQGFDLLNDGGTMSLIVPNTFCDLESCDQFRRWLLSNHHLAEIWQTGWAFASAVVDTLVFVVNKQSPSTTYPLTISIDDRRYERDTSEFFASPLAKIDYRNSRDDHLLLQSVVSERPTVEQFATARAGVKLYEKGKGNPPQTADTLKKRPYTVKGAALTGWRILYRGIDVEKYRLAIPGEFVHYGPWLAAPRDESLFESPKILMRRTDDRLMSCIDRDSAIAVNSCHVIKFKPNCSRYSLHYLLALLNSRLLQRIFELQNPQMVGKVFAEIKVIYVERLPFRTIDFANPVDVSRHDHMVALVERMLALHEQVKQARTAFERNALQRQIDATDKQIDWLVYELYELTGDEIRIVEEATAR